MKMAKLQELIVSLFASNEEMRRFAVLRLEDGHNLATKLPSVEVSQQSYALSLCEHLQRHGYLGSEFFQVLAKEFKRRAADIHKVATSWAGIRTTKGAVAGETAELTLQLGFKLRQATLLQRMSALPGAQRAEVDELAGRLVLQPHVGALTDQTIKDYYDQLENSKQQDLFNLGFHLAMAEIGLMLISAPRTEANLQQSVRLQLAECREDIANELVRVGLKEVQAPAEFAEKSQVTHLHSQIIGALRGRVEGSTPV